MDAARPLRDVFADLASDDAARQTYRADPDGFLAANGHGDLPADLVAEAVVSYADLAPLETAEHLAPVVMAHSAVPFDGADGIPEDLHGLGASDDVTVATPDPLAALDLLATAPAPADQGETAGIGDEDAAELADVDATEPAYATEPADTTELDDRFGEGDPGLLDHLDDDAAPAGFDDPDELDHLTDSLLAAPDGSGTAREPAAEPDLQTDDLPPLDESEDLGSFLTEVDGPPEEPEEDIADM